jgi:hypothetical protein
MVDRAWAGAEYSRIYWTIVDDEKFADVFWDDACWAAYTRLLMAAEQAYPSPAQLPRWLEDRVLETLVDARIVELAGRAGYRIVGLKAEREGRMGGNRVGGKARVSTAVRDEHGRFVAGETLAPLDGAGGNAGSSDAGTSEPARRDEEETRRDETRDSPLPPTSGGRRANGTSPRQLSERDRDRRRYRRTQRQLAYHRGALTEELLDDMNVRDAPLEEIPDWAEHRATLEAEAVEAWA